MHHSALLNRRWCSKLSPGVATSANCPPDPWGWGFSQLYTNGIGVWNATHKEAEAFEFTIPKVFNPFKGCDLRDKCVVEGSCCAITPIQSLGDAGANHSRPQRDPLGDGVSDLTSSTTESKRKGTCTDASHPLRP